MFSDRRARTDRRKNDLPIPAGLDRREGGRRNQYFKSNEWWLEVDYADEFISEKAFAEELRHLKQAKKNAATQSKTNLKNERD